MKNIRDGRRNDRDRANWLYDGTAALDLQYMEEDSEECSESSEMTGVAEIQDFEDDTEDIWWIRRLAGLVDDAEVETSEVYERLSPAAVMSCCGAGLLELIILFLLLGLQAALLPAVTLVFLWFLCSAITAGIVLEVKDWKNERKDCRDGDSMTWERQAQTEAER